MATKGGREKIKLESTAGTGHFYTTNKNKKTITDALDTFPQALSVLRNNRSKLTTMLVSLSRLGSVATNVIKATQTNFVSSLKSLAPVVEQLTASGSNLVPSPKIARAARSPDGTGCRAGGAGRRPRL